MYYMPLYKYGVSRSDYTYINMVREPADRLASFFYFRRRSKFRRKKGDRPVQVISNIFYMTDQVNKIFLLGVVWSWLQHLRSERTSRMCIWPIGWQKLQRNAADVLLWLCTRMCASWQQRCLASKSILLIVVICNALPLYIHCHLKFLNHVIQNIL